MANKTGGNKLIDLKFGVAGGGSLNGDTGAQILKDLQDLVKNLEDNPVTQIKFKLDPTSLNAIKQQFSAAFKDAIMAATTSVTGPRDTGSGGTKSPSVPSAPAINSARTLDASTEVVPRYATAAAYSAEIKNIKAAATEALKTASESEAETIKATRDSQVLQLENEKSWLSERNKIQKDYYAEQKRLAQESAAAEAARRKENLEARKIEEREARKAEVNARRDLNNQLQLTNVASSARNYYERFESSIRGDSGLDAKWRSHLDKLLSGDYGDAQKARKDLAALRLETELLDANTETLGARVQRLFNDHFSTAIAMAGVHALQNALTGVYDNVVALDAAVVDLQVATGMSRSETQALVSDYADYAKELGSTTADVAAAADSWLRQGYNIEESNKLIKDSMMLSKLGQLESADATQALTSTMKGYQIAVAETTSIVDKFTAVDMEAAISAGDIATAMSKTANSARLAGVDINRLTGYITAVGEATQESAEVTGNFYKTLFARMGNIKAGRLEDPETGESLSDVESTLSGAGIDLRDSEKEFRDFSDVLDDVYAKWDSFSSVQQRAVAVAFGGTRQQERFFALMENYGTALKYAEIAANSAGSALEKYENTYLSSVEAAQNRFTASFEKLSTTVLNSDLVAGTFNTGSGILSFFDTLLSMGDGALIYVPLLLKVLSAGSKIFDALTDSSSNTEISFFKLDKAVGKALINLGRVTDDTERTAAELATLHVSTLTLAEKFDILTESFIKNGRALLTHPLTKAAVIAAGVIVLLRAIDPLITTYDEWKVKLEEVNAELEAITGEGSEYAELSSRTHELTEAEWERYWVLKSQTEELKEQQRLAEDALFEGRESNDLSMYQDGDKWIETTVAGGWTKDINSRLLTTDTDVGYLSEASKITSEYSSEYEKLNNWKEQGKNLTADETAFLKRYGDMLSVVKILTEKMTVTESEAADSTANLSKSYEALFEVLDKLSDTMSSVPKAMEDFGKDGKLGFSSLSDLRTQFQDLPEIDAYIATLSRADLTADTLKSTLLEMTTSLVQVKFETGELVAQDKELIAKMLEEQGVVNSTDLVMRSLAQSMFGVNNTDIDLVAQIESIMALAMAAMTASEQLNYLLSLTGQLGYIPNDAEGEGGIADQFAAKVPDLKYTGGGGGGSSYAAEIDELRDARQKLLDVETELNMVLARRETIDESDGAALAENAKQALDLYKAQQEAMHNLNNETDARIQQIVDQLRGVGFDVLYNADTNDFWVSNIELIKTFSSSAQETYDALIQKAEAYNTENVERSLEWWNIQKSILDLQKELREIETDNLNSLVDMVKDQITQEYEDQIDALNDQIDAFDKIIERRKEILRLAERERGYQSDVADLVEEISKLQDQADKLELDGSRAASAQRGSVLEQLAAKQKELDELQRNNYVEVTEEALDKESENYKDSMEDKIEDLEDFLDDNLRLTEAAYARIDKQGDKLYDSLLAYALKYTETTREEFDNMWDSAIAAAQKYGSVVAGLKGEYTPEASDARIRSIVSEMKTNSAAWHSASPAEQKKMEAVQQKLGEELKELLPGLTYNSAEGRWYVNGVPLYSIYHDGGVAGDNPTLKQKEIMAKLEEGEMTLTGQHQDNLYSRLKLSDVGARLLELIQTNVPQITMRGNVNPALAGASGDGRSVVVHSDIYIQGGADESVLEQIKKYPREVANIVSKELKKF